MLILSDSIQIDVSPDKVFDWFSNLDKNFTKWSPNHKKFVLVTGGLDEGDVIYFEQNINGKWFNFKTKITKIEQTATGWTIETKTPPFVTLIFTAQANTTGCLFTHDEVYGFIKIKNLFIRKYSIPFLRTLLNPFFRFDLIEKDIADDNARLKQILERENEHRTHEPD